MKSCNYQDPLKIQGRFRGYSKEELIKNLPRHNKFNPSLLKKLNKIPEVVLRNSGNLMAKKFNQMMKEVSLEAYRAKQFTRTEINDKGVLYGVVLLKHRVIDIILRYFHERWPQCVICLYNEYSYKTSIIDENGKIKEFDLPLKETVRKVGKNRAISPFFQDIQYSGEEVFETLYKSQYIKERYNRNYFKQMIPNYCYKLPGMKKGIEKRFHPKNKKLDDY